MLKDIHAMLEELVDTEDQEECKLCQVLEDRYCLYHDGVFEGYDRLSQTILGVIS